MPISNHAVVSWNCKVITFLINFHPFILISCFVSVHMLTCILEPPKSVFQTRHKLKCTSDCNYLTQEWISAYLPIISVYWLIKCVWYLPHELLFKSSINLRYTWFQAHTSFNTNFETGFSSFEPQDDSGSTSFPKAGSGIPEHKRRDVTVAYKREDGDGVEDEI